MDNKKPVANPFVVLREEFDDWAVLYDLDTGEGYGVNPIGVFVWKRLDGKHSIQDILSDLRANCDNVPEDAEEHVRKFIDELVECGLVGYEFQDS